MGDQVKEEADIVDEQSQDRVQFSLRRLSSYIFSFFKVSCEGKLISKQRSMDILKLWRRCNIHFFQLVLHICIMQWLLESQRRKNRDCAGTTLLVTASNAHTHTKISFPLLEFHMPPWKSKRVITGDRVLVFPLLNNASTVECAFQQKRQD